MPDPKVPDLAPLRDWFASYCSSFRVEDPEVQRNFDLKEFHTRKVCEAARLIAWGGSAKRLMLAETAALCHDVGRFPQFRDYGTFKDSDSVNHARLSAEVVKREGVLNFLPDSERDSVITAVRLHNVFELPTGLSEEACDLLKVVRDADKVDIWRVFIEYFDCPEEERASGAGLGFPDLSGCSEEVLATVRAGKMVQLSMLKSLNDFKLLQLSWLYDINFPNTFRLIKDRRLLERLAATLPREGAVVDVLAQVQNYLKQRVLSGRDPETISDPER
jgi:hypothetical protein